MDKRDLDNFDDILKSKFNETQPFPFEEKDWDALEARLPLPPARRRFGWWLFVLFLFSLGLLTNNIVLQQKISKLENISTNHVIKQNEISEQSTPLSNALKTANHVVVYDTIRKKIVITDTIWHMVKRAKSENRDGQESRSIATIENEKVALQKIKALEDLVKQQKQQLENQAILLKNAGQIPPSVTANEALTIAQKQNSKNKVANLDSTQIDSLERVMNKAIKQIKDSLQKAEAKNIANKIIPNTPKRDLWVGLTVGRNIANFINSPSIGFGLQAEYQIIKNLRLTTDFNIIKFNHEFKKENYNYATYANEIQHYAQVLSIPEPLSRIGDYNLTKVECEQTIGQATIGLHYAPFVRKRFQPSVGVGYTWRVVMPFEVEYKYYNNRTNVELEIEENIINKYYQNIITSNINVDYQVSSRWLARCQVFWSRSLDQSKTYDIWGLRLGTLYRLNR